MASSEAVFTRAQDARESLRKRDYRNYLGNRRFVSVDDTDYEYGSCRVSPGHELSLHERCVQSNLRWRLLVLRGLGEREFLNHLAPTFGLRVIRILNLVPCEPSCSPARNANVVASPQCLQIERAYLIKELSTQATPATTVPMSK